MRKKQERREKKKGVCGLRAAVAHTYALRYSAAFSSRLRCRRRSQTGGAAPLPSAQARRAHLQGAPQLRPHAGAAAGHHIQHRPVRAGEWGSAGRCRAQLGALWSRQAAADQGRCLFLLLPVVQNAVAGELQEQDFSEESTQHFPAGEPAGRLEPPFCFPPPTQQLSPPTPNGACAGWLAVCRAGDRAVHVEGLRPAGVPPPAAELWH